ncbi:heavy metal-associated isoprenylated plant protein 28-like [Apium graveolens]|uniref:heavy metal-associated isoprenylated plant protein 28-like n=1 Tax=Apium graveolens TaxID=4045 RepID=UPI003D7B31EE
MSTIVEMMVHMDCSGCEKKIMKALSRLDGVENVEIDMEMQKVTVTGYVDQEKVLKTAGKNGRQAELWQFQYNADYQDFDQYYNNDQYQSQSNPTAYSSSDYNPTYTYYEHGYNVHKYSYEHQNAYSSTIHTQPALALFSDENTSACSIM